MLTDDDSNITLADGFIVSLFEVTVVHKQLPTVKAGSEVYIV
ncbi:hypothetical protein [Paenibacillus phytorum]|nr:hypothetical protein [Paenibacillus phytorum]